MKFQPKREIKKVSYNILRFGLPTVTLTLLYIAIYTYIYSARPWAIQTTMTLVPEMLEHALMSLALILGGSLITEYMLQP
jgi:hypothetical protein